MIISSFYDSRFGYSRTVISKCINVNEEPDFNSVKAYIDTYCPLKYRLVNNKDSLDMVKSTGDLKSEFPAGYSNGNYIKLPKIPGFKTKF